MKNLLVAVLGCLLFSACAAGTERYPLHDVIYKNNVAAVKALIDQGADVNAIDTYGHTPLIAAAGNKSMEITKYLVEHGADINQANDGGDTALHYAAGDCDFIKAKYLLENGADASIKNIKHVTFVYYLGLCRKFKDSFGYLADLLSAGRDHVFEKDRRGHSFYTVAVSRKFLYGIATMRKAGITESYFQGYTPEQVTRLPNFYNPAFGNYLVTEGKEEFYRLAVEDCNVYVRGGKGIREKELSPFSDDSGDDSGHKKKFSQCMEAMGFKYVGEK
jgi:hypothetical protein